MCYKDEEERQLQEKLNEQIKDMPDFIKKYFTYINSNITKINNWNTIKNMLEWFISKGLIHTDLYYVTTEELVNIEDNNIIDYLESLRLGLDGKKLALSSINTNKNRLSGFWSYLVDKGYVNRNVITKAVNNKFKVKDKEVESPSDENVEMFLKNLEGIKSEIISIRNIAIVKLFLGSGIRLDELIGLDLSDLHFEEENPYIEVLGKGIHGEENKDNVPINQSAIISVNDYLTLRNELDDLEDTNALFISEKKDKDTGKRKRVGKFAINKFFAEYSNKTIHPHSLRHYVGTKMYENSENDIVAVSKQLRHKSVVTTSKSYVKKNMDNTYKALNMI